MKPELISAAPGERWAVRDAGDEVVVWIDEKGFHTKRISYSSGREIHHAVTTIPLSDLIDKAEKQLPLFGVLLETLNEKPNPK